MSKSSPKDDQASSRFGRCDKKFIIKAWIPNKRSGKYGKNWGNWIRKKKLG